MSDLLNEIREKARSRAEELQKDIQEAIDIISLCESELTPLLAIIKATNSKLAPATGESPEVPGADPNDADKGSVAGLSIRTAARAVKLPSVKLPSRWSQYKLPPRCRLFLAQFGDTQGQIRIQAIMAWYRTVTPTITDTSLMQAAYSMTGILVRKGILHKDAPSTWSFLKGPSSEGR